MARDRKVQGIGGWLLVYLVILAGGIIISLIALFLERGWLQNATFESIFSWVIPNWLFSICIIILMLAKEKRGVNWILGFVWANFIIITIGFFGLFVGNGAFPIISHSLSVWVWWLLSAAAAGGTTLYFKKSERVKNTFVKSKKK